jgi:dihydropteroate synthase
VISIDTSHADVARRAIEMGASMINDVRALENPDLRSLAAEIGVPVVLMHMQGRPETMQDSPGYKDCIGEVYSFLELAVERARESGIPKDLIVVDPGIGFGKRLRDNLDILRRLGEFRWLGCPVMLGHSRKSFIAHVLGDIPAEERDAYTHQVTAIIGRNADLLRVHDVPGTLRALRISGLISGQATDEESSGE